MKLFQIKRHIRDESQPEPTSPEVSPIPYTIYGVVQVMGSEESASNKGSGKLCFPAVGHASSHLLKPADRTLLQLYRLTAGSCSPSLEMLTKLQTPYKGDAREATGCKGVLLISFPLRLAALYPCRYITSSTGTYFATLKLHS